MTKKQEIVLESFKSLNLDSFEIMKILDMVLIDFKISKELDIRMYRVRLFKNGSIHVQEHHIYSEYGTIYTKDIPINYRFKSLNYFIESLKERIK